MLTPWSVPITDPLPKGCRVELRFFGYKEQGTKRGPVHRLTNLRLASSVSAKASFNYFVVDENLYF